MSWNPKYILLIVFSSLTSYLGALLIEKSQSIIAKKTILVFSISISLGCLIFFKYFNFFSEEFVKIVSLFGIKYSPIMIDVILPVGISFYTFQTLSYVIDVYNGGECEKNFGKYSAFVSFFPQLVAGPIERSADLLPQIKKEHSFVYEEGTYGLKLMLWGFFKKVVIADTLAGYVDSVFDSSHEFKGFALVCATVMFAIQIYCDFSGYSDIARGTAKLFNINLLVNFNSPYLSKSFKEFWERWHISLSRWFKDYLYIPLGGNRKGKSRTYINLVITFMLSGLWHGANVTYIAWGGLAWHCSGY